MAKRDEKLKQLAAKASKPRLDSIVQDTFISLLASKIEQLNGVVEHGINLNTGNLEEMLGKSISIDVREFAEQVGTLNKVIQLVDNLVRSLESVYIPVIPKEIELKGAQELEAAISRPVALKDLEKLTDAIANIRAETKVFTSDIYDEYKAANSDYTNGSIIYHGFINRQGRWFVMRQLGTDKNVSYKYASGTGSYEKSWLNRQSLDYVLYSEVGL